MARNRKRAKERRARRPQPVPSRGRDRATGAPNPLEHAAPDAEIAEQAELPPDLTEPELEELEAEEVPQDEELEERRSTRLGALAADAAEDDEAEFEEEEDALDAGVGGGGRRRGRTGAGFGDGGSSGGEAAAALPVTRVVPGNRLINFLQGSWRELQRVQWPDRQQVIQATGVVIGFVIIAGVFLGVADWASGHIISLIENGHF